MASSARKSLWPEKHQEIAAQFPHVQRAMTGALRGVPTSVVTPSLRRARSHNSATGFTVPSVLEMCVNAKELQPSRVNTSSKLAQIQQALVARDWQINQLRARCRFGQHLPTATMFAVMLHPP